MAGSPPSGRPTGVGAAPGIVPRSQAFRERARLEADRYGPDPWIFVRELLQNSRDAGARDVAFSVREGDGREVVICVDDGEGMTFEHARRYLFALYASSKEDSKNQAGKFGVGFWSVLRFDPMSITIRSCPRNGQGWGLRLDGALEHAAHVTPLERPGTEITLARAGGDGRLEHRVYDAVWQSARYLHRRDNQDSPLPVTVNGRPANAEFALDAPSATFRRGSVRGVVGLGPAPRVELFSRGLRVRSAACLEDLVAPTGRHTSRMRVQFPELPGGLAPQALLESDRLEVMLSRSDARDNRALSRLVKLAQQELERLIDRQLSQARPQPLWRRAWDFVVGRFRESLALRTITGSLVGAAVAAVIGWFLWGETATEPTVPAEIPTEIAVAGNEPAVLRPYQDLGARYRGPKVDVLAPGSAEPIPLRYEPPGKRLHFAALTFRRLADDGKPEHDAAVEELHDYPGVTCDRDCVEVSLPVVSTGGAMRIPVPTGHRVVEGSAELDGTPVGVFASGEGHPAIALHEPVSGVLRYRTVAASDPTWSIKLQTSPALPKRLVRKAEALTTKGIEDRVDTLLKEVRALVRYDRAPETATRHTQAMKAGQGFIDRTLAIGAGDCDVQNGLLVAMLHAADVEARLAVGYIGSHGMVHPWLHAWVEYRDEGGTWHIADASEGGGIELPPLPATPRPPTRGGTKRVPPVIAVAGDGDGDGDGVGDGVGDGGEVDEQGEDPAQESAASVGPVAAVSTSPEPAPAAAAPPPAPADAPPAPQGAPPQDKGAVAWVRHIDDDYPWVVRGLPILLVLLAAWSLLSGRTRRAIKLDQTADLSRLLQGVLQQPGAFSQMSALFTRPLVPLIDGDAISLNRARELASIGRLYRTERRPALAKRAVRAGAAVLDVATPEGRTVADALGAVDLDRWASWLDASRATPLTTALNAELRARGEDWGVRVSSSVPGAVAVLDIGNLGVKLPGFRGTRLVLLDDSASWLVQASIQAEHAPQAAAFILLDIVIDRLDLPAERRARLLSERARRALLESFARG